MAELGSTRVQWGISPRAKRGLREGSVPGEYKA